MSAEPLPAVLVVDDEPSSTEVLRVTLTMDYTVYTANDGPTALRLLDEHPEIAVAIIDQRMPGMTGLEFIEQSVAAHPHLVRIILTGYTDVDSLIAAINAGHIYRYLTKPWERDHLLLAVRQGLEVHRLAVDNQRLQEELRRANERLREENSLLRREARGRYRFDEIIGSSPALQKTLDAVERVVASDTTVLILGETGTGKELLARAIHYNGPRADKPFVSENCGAMAPDLLTSELFGHKRGAFTGASDDRPGLFEKANGGTLFLDEIGDCPSELQTRLLRVLDQGEIRRVGDDHTIPVDVRIIAATHHDLELDVREGRFRKDLYYRLSVFTITPPPLRDRTEDIPALVQHFLDQLASRNRRRVLGLTPDALALLAAYDFPGNIRELENELERAFMMAEADTYITPELLSGKFQRSTPAATGGALKAAVDRFESDLLREALARNGGHQTRTAAELGLSRRALFDKLQKHGIKV